MIKSQEHLTFYFIPKKQDNEKTKHKEWMEKKSWLETELLASAHLVKGVQVQRQAGTIDPVIYLLFIYLNYFFKLQFIYNII